MKDPQVVSLSPMHHWADQKIRTCRNSFPLQTLVRGGDMDRLASVTVAVGSVRNIALAGVFLAADDDALLRVR